LHDFVRRMSIPFLVSDIGLLTGVITAATEAEDIPASSLGDSCQATLRVSAH